MRKAALKRETSETKVDAALNLDGEGIANVNTGVGFFDHMMTLLAVHSGFNIFIEAEGDLEVDTHHTVEDIGIVLGKIFKKALGDKIGINRYGAFTLAMDEVLVLTALDISGRSYIVYENPFTCERIGQFETETLEDFLRAFVMNAEITLNIKFLDKGNNHHMCEALFKSLARALKEATEITGDKLPSSKGVL